MANDWYGDEWGSLGWTAQQPSNVAGPTTPPITFPPGFTSVDITAKYVDDQSRTLNGSMVRFTPSARRVVDGDTVVWLEAVHERIDHGLLTVSLLATDVAGVSPAFTWHVKECFPGGREWDITVPAATVSPVSLFALPEAIPS